MANPEYNEKIFYRSVPGGFKQVFKLLSDAFNKYYPGNIKAHGATRRDKVVKIDHPLRRIGDLLARDYGINGYEAYILKSKPTALIVENTDPPAVLIGKGLLHEATDEEIQFLMGRSLWIIQRSMILPACLRSSELELLVAGIVRQYNPEFQTDNADEKALLNTTKKVNRAIPRKLRQELMPFALECSGSSAMMRSLGASVIHSANRAGLLVSRSIIAALTVLRKMAGHAQSTWDPDVLIRSLEDSTEAAELLRFAVSDDHLELRREMRIGLR
jgi:hypothetical protein